MASKYEYIKIGLASPEKILEWSHGEVKTSETINYRTLKPEPDGLFCEKIFGPVKDNSCYCGKSRKGGDYDVCPHCGVEITSSKVRRERMGHIVLNAPVVHTWYLKNGMNPIANLLGIKKQDLLDIVYYSKYIVVDPGDAPVAKKDIIEESTYKEYSYIYGDKFQALIGGEAIKKLLEELDLKQEEKNLKQRLKNCSKQERVSCTKRLEVVRAFLNSDNKPEWMVLSVLPVLPPDLRPMVPLDGGRFATTDINDLYRDIINRNNRLKKFNEVQLCKQNEQRILQVAVDDLIDSSTRNKKMANDKRKQKKSLTSNLSSKQGRFRQNLLGKRVDYSGRSVIVIGPNLKMYQCGIPREMALKLFEPFVIREIINMRGCSLREAKNLVERKDGNVLRILDDIVREHPVLLNRAPTLHRLGIQAFEPVLIDGKAIRLHPLVCTAFNADFDGDQMAVHVPLSLEAQAEARLLMLASNNILSPKDGKPVVTPSQDMVLGNYYLTMEKSKQENEGHFFKDYSEAYIAYKNKVITLHTRIFVDPHYLPETRFTNVDIKGKYLYTTMGKMIFNSIIPDDFPYLNEPLSDSLQPLKAKYLFDPKTDDCNEFISRDVVEPFNKKCLAKIIAEVFKKYKITETSAMLDRLKDLGFKYSTISGITISMGDVIKYDDKDIQLQNAEKEVDFVKHAYELGWMTERERKANVSRIWTTTRDNIQVGLWKELKKHKDNPIFIMADSGSRGSDSNFAQLAGMRGQMSNTQGEAIEIPVKANFREGLSVSEFFISTHGARKGSTDTALKTADSGYLTRRLVEVAQDVIITEDDCGTDRGILYEDLTKSTEDGEIILYAYERAIGRFAAEDIYDEKGNLICKRNTLITEDVSHKMQLAGLTKVYVRTSLTCACKHGVCKKCYGRNLATNAIVEVGEAVGVVAAQSIGEPGTQLTMRTFHTGGVASGGDITQGLPRVQEILEVKRPKGMTTLSEVNGKVIEIKRLNSGGDKITILSEDGETVDYTVDATSEKRVNINDTVKRGDALTRGAIYPQDLLRITDLETTQKYIINEIHRVYLAQGVSISDKHIEIIVKQLTRKVVVIDPGDTSLIPDRKVSITEFREAVKDAIMNKKLVLPKARPVIQGLIKTGVSSDSFLSAASFQQTMAVLSEAAIRGKKDPLLGLKENVLIGGLIPAGTGLLRDTYFECPHEPIPEEELVDEDLLDLSENNVEIEEFVGDDE